MIQTQNKSNSANDNLNPLIRADSAVLVLQRHRREVLEMNPGLFDAEQLRERTRVLKNLDKAIAMCTEKL